MSKQTKTTRKGRTGKLLIVLAMILCVAKATPGGHRVVNPGRRDDIASVRVR